MVSGVQEYLDANEFGDFNVIAVGPDSSGIVRMWQLLSASLDGNLVIPLGGWYSTATYNDSTVYYRTGGHFVALTSALWQSSNSDQVAFQIANPWTYDDLTVQSPYAYQSFTAQASSIEFTQVDSNNMPIPDTQNTLTADFMDQSNGWILDGAVEIQPLKGYTVHNNLIFQYMPQQFMNIRQQGLGFASYDGSSVVAFSRDPITDNLYYTTALNPYAIVCVNPTSGETNVQQTRGPLRGMSFGFEREPYVLTGDSTISMLGTNSDANPFSFTADFPIDTFSFDPSHNSLVAVSARSHKIVYLDKFLQSVKIMRLPVAPSGDGALTVQVGPNGKTMLFRSGSSKLLEVWRHKKGEDDDDSDGDDQGLRWRQIELPKAVRGATTFSVDDWGRTYFSVGGLIVALNKRGHVIQTPFSGLMGGESLTLTRSGSNFDPALHTGPGWVNNVPDGAFRGSQGN